MARPLDYGTAAPGDRQGFNSLLTYSQNSAREKLLRHRCLVQRHFVYEPTPPKAVDGSGAQILTIGAERWAGARRFYGSVARENATVGAILLWLLGIPIPIIILLLLLWH
jgi:hypothetical protein